MHLNVHHLLGWRSRTWRVTVAVAQGLGLCIDNEALHRECGCAQGVRLCAGNGAVHREWDTAYGVRLYVENGAVHRERGCA